VIQRIIIGKQGAVIKAIHAEALEDLKQLLGQEVVLILHIRVLDPRSTEWRARTLQGGKQ